jgi:TonB family protein
MKRCQVCGEEFSDQFSFCPVDGKPLGAASGIAVAQTSVCDHSFRPTAPDEFRLTLIGDEGLPRRLANQLSFAADQVRLAWPTFKNDPMAFTFRRVNEGKRLFKQALTSPHVLSGAMTAVFIVAVVITSVFVLERHARKGADDANLIDDGNQFLQTVEIDLRNTNKQDDDSGVGAGDKGRVGFARGKGEGSGPVPQRAQGGGGGGMGDRLPASQGRLPVPSVIPVPISTTMARLPQALPDAGLDIDPALWRNLSSTSYGDPRAKSNMPSNGPGEGGGVGPGKGTGIGEGDGPGFGPGRDGNMGGGPKAPGGGGSGGSRGNNPNPDPDRVYSSPEVTERARVLSKPEPQYTEEARRASITGTVILRVVFSRTGEVTNIRAVQPLGGGLTEKAITAARQIRFVPARKNGQPVSMYMQLEYNFNLY